MPYFPGPFPEHADLTAAMNKLIEIMVLLRREDPPAMPPFENYFPGAHFPLAIFSIWTK
jgi:hypothetical protein